MEDLHVTRVGFISSEALADPSRTIIALLKANLKKLGYPLAKLWIHEEIKPNDSFVLVRHGDAKSARELQSCQNPPIPPPREFALGGRLAIRKYDSVRRTTDGITWDCCAPPIVRAHSDHPGACHYLIEDDKCPVIGCEFAHEGPIFDLSKSLHDMQMRISDCADGKMCCLYYTTTGRCGKANCPWGHYKSLRNQYVKRILDGTLSEVFTDSVEDWQQRTSSPAQASSRSKPTATISKQGTASSRPPLAAMKTKQPTSLTFDSIQAKPTPEKPITTPASTTVPSQLTPPIDDDDVLSVPKKSKKKSKKAKKASSIETDSAPSASEAKTAATTPLPASPPAAAPPLSEIRYDHPVPTFNFISPISFNSAPIDIPLTRYSPPSVFSDAENIATQSAFNVLRLADNDDSSSGSEFSLFSFPSPSPVSSPGPARRGSSQSLSSATASSSGSQSTPRSFSPILPLSVATPPQRDGPKISVCVIRPGLDKSVRRIELEADQRASLSVLHSCVCAEMEIHPHILRSLSVVARNGIDLQWPEEIYNDRTASRLCENDILKMDLLSY